MRAASLALAGALLPLTAAQGAAIYVNSYMVQGYARTATVFGTKYRMSHTNWDMELGRSSGTANPATYITAGLGANSNHPSGLVGRTYDLEIEHLAGEGFIYRMINGTVSTTTLSWGTFSPTPPGATVQTLQGASPGAAFNALIFNARASRDPSSMTFSNFSFSSPTLAIADGAFVNGSANTPGTAFVTQLLVSTENLAAHDWVVRGKVTGVRSTGAGGDEQLWFTVEGQDANFTITPEPGGLLLVGGGLALAAGQRRAARKRAISGASAGDGLAR
ncbi:MAG TPA: hypothetical protein DEH78_15345 [Solibacterales bacterium]|nr:hypothetical protein [Bryobacterales bacterium]